MKKQYLVYIGLAVVAYFAYTKLKRPAGATTNQGDQVITNTTIQQQKSEPHADII